jgi:hypothetical protein
VHRASWLSNRASAAARGLGQRLRCSVEREAIGRGTSSDARWPTGPLWRLTFKHAVVRRPWTVEGAVGDLAGVLVHQVDNAGLAPVEEVARKRAGGESASIRLRLPGSFNERAGRLGRTRRATC